MNGQADQREEPGGRGLKGPTGSVFVSPHKGRADLLSPS